MMWNNVNAWLGQVTVPEWYGVVLGGALLLWLTCRAASRLLRWIAQRTKVCWLRHGRYRPLAPALRGCGFDTPEVALLAIAYVALNLAWMLVWADSADAIRGRAGVLALCNLLPLTLGLHLCVAADIIGWTVPVYQKIHRWVGVVCSVEVLVHAALSFAPHPSVAHAPHAAYLVSVLALAHPFHERGGTDAA
ncbi:hypothetical protein PISL3812_10019 [Talaromyces islandicus]|uniref:Ferric oxidoreductase domain-containing protein n=1 Tax=Talaromyces islandicus TaxID=28573 RepID=A0A0U1MC72_TALIS|nr:hypothetical protein PISL3812_10019 [Talaromyces islandicus]